ncbi:hypothetical protein JCM5296_005131 [Sporobolomyces johnsonii]
MAKPASLDSLPPELLVQVFSFLDFPSLANIVRTTRTFHTVAVSYPEHLCRAICIRQGLAGAKTAGAASPLSPEGLADKALTDELDPEELREVVAQQTSMSEAFKEVDSWSSYARLRWAIDRNWRHGRATWRPVIALDFAEAIRAGLPPIRRFWRFKLDTAAGLIVVTGLLGGYYAFDKSGKLAWSCRLPATHNPHVELSSSHLSMAITGGFWIIWRYTSSPPPASFPQDMLTQLTPHFHLHNGHEVGYVPHAILTADLTCAATKLRYPTLLATSTDASIAYHWNITDSSLHMLDTSEFTRKFGEDHVSYVELDGVNTFIAGHHSITIWKNHEHAPHARRVTTWPPAPPPNYRLLEPLFPEPHYRDMGKNPRWSAVHHDGRGRHLVAISQRSWKDEIARLMWTVDYDSTIWSEDREEVEQKTLVLVTEDADLVQLAVENDRAVFVADHPQLGNSLWLLNLRTHNGLSDFVRDPPRPICLAYPLPSLLPPSRVEMTSTEIFVPAWSRLYPPALPDPSDPTYRLAAAFRACVVPGAQTTVSDPPSVAPVRFKWQTLDGQTLKNYEDESIKPDTEEFRQMAINWRRVCRQVEFPSEGSDSLLSLSFVPQTETDHTP